MMTSTAPAPAAPSSSLRRPAAPPLRRPLVVAALAAAALLLCPAGLASQEPGGPGRAEEGRPAVEAAVFGGILAPLGRLTTDPESFETEVSSSALVGAELTWWARPRLGASAQVAWAPAKLSLIPTDFTGALPDDLGDADYLAASVELRYRLRVPPEAELLRPYLALGGGVRRLSVQPIASPEVADATDPMATAAAGSHVRIGRDVDIRFEVRDRVSLYRSPRTGDERLQNDLGITVGLGVGLASP